ncbi:MAG: ISAs1 family transposase [Synergistaceae bacterium]|nr:ISAs1 family transposase [Synergistaceae bacterium]
METRTIYSANIVDGIEELKEWAGLKSVTMAVSKREVMGSTPTEECRYCLSSLEADAEGIGKAIREHWGIENGLHWVLDVNFREDYAGNRKRHSAENMAILRHRQSTL